MPQVKQQANNTTKKVVIKNNYMHLKNNNKLQGTNSENLYLNKAI